MGKITRTGSLALAAAIAATLAVAPGALADDGDVNPSIPDASGEVGRIAGQDRVRTAVAASQALTSTPGWTGSTVIIASSDSARFADALASAPLADELNAPLLVNNQNVLNNYVRDELVRLSGRGVTNVIIVGGDAAISNGVEAAIRDLEDEDTEVELFGVTRIAGDDRYDTAVAVATETLANYREGSATANAYRTAQGTLRTALEAVAAVAPAEAAFQEAQQAYAAAVAALAEAEAAEAAILAEQAALADQLVTETEAPGGVTWTEYVDEARGLVLQAQARVDAARAVSAALTRIDDVDPATTVAEFVADPESDEAVVEAIEDALEAAAAAGVTVDTTATPAAVIQALAEDLNEAGGFIEVRDAALAEVSDREARRAEAAADTAANEAIFAQIAALAPRLVAAAEAAEDASEDAAEAFGDFQTALGEYTTALQAGSTVTPLIPGYERALEQARQALIATGNSHEVFLTTGTDFADALSAGAAASHEDGVVLLTSGEIYVDASADYVEASGAEVHAIGGPSARAAGADADETIIGAERYETAALTAAEYFDGAALQNLAVASGYNAADALVASAFIGNAGGPLLLSYPGGLPASTREYIQFEAPGADVFVFGGTSAIAATVVDQIKDAKES